MQIKKNPDACLENYSKLFALIGLVLALFIVHLLIEVKSYDDSLRDTLGNVTMVDEDKEDESLIDIAHHFGKEVLVTDIDSAIGLQRAERQGADFAQGERVAPYSPFE